MKQNLNLDQLYASAVVELAPGAGRWTANLDCKVRDHNEASFGTIPKATQDSKRI